MEPGHPTPVVMWSDSPPPPSFSSTAAPSPSSSDSGRLPADDSVSYDGVDAKDDGYPGTGRDKHKQGRRAGAVPRRGSIQSIYFNPVTRAYRWLFPRRQHHAGLGLDAAAPDGPQSALSSPTTLRTVHETTPFLKAGADADADGGGGGGGNYGTVIARAGDDETLVGSSPCWTPSSLGANAFAEDEQYPTWQHEAVAIVRSAMPLIMMYLLWQSMSMAGLFIVGRLGNAELGAVNLSMTAQIMLVFSPAFGVGSALDTLCPQAYGSGNYHLVGMHVQRAFFMLVALMVPITAAMYWGTGPVLGLMVKERDTIELTVQYVRITMLSTPALALWECSKRFLMAQGIFYPLMWVLLICAPLNVLLAYTLCWHLGWGFVGVPIALTLSQNLMPLLLVLYVWRVDGQRCWGGLSWRAFENWGSTARLAGPAIVMTTAEVFCFEIMTIGASSLGNVALATQSIAVLTMYGMYKIPLGISIAGGTRVANFLGAGQIRAARQSAKVLHALCMAAGVFMSLVVTANRERIPRWITDDTDVIEAAAQALVVVVCIELPDALSCHSQAIVRSLGRQGLGGWINMVVWLGLTAPLALFLGIKLGYGVGGLWVGGGIGMVLIWAVETIYIWQMDWRKAYHEAAMRNHEGLTM